MSVLWLTCMDSCEKYAIGVFFLPAGGTVSSKCLNAKMQ